MAVEQMPGEEADLARRAYEAWQRYDRAFDALCTCYRERLSKFCRRLLNNDDDGEDATQMALQRALKSFATLDSPEAFRGWLYRIARNCCADVAKKRNRMLTNLQNEPNDPFVDIPDPDDPIKEMHEAAAVKEAICAAKAAIAARDELDRSICELLWVDGIKNIAEISRKLNRPENTIRSRVEKIREKVAEIGRHINNG